MSKKNSIRIAIIGGGTIGSAIAVPLAKEGFSVTITRRNPEKIKNLEEYGIEVGRDNRDAILKSELVIFALKPYDILAEMKLYATYLKGKIVISMAAAISLSQLKSVLKESYLVRAMTNIAARSGSGFTPFCVASRDEGKIKIVQKVLGSFGEMQLVEEKYMDALTALSGSGPAYILTIIEAMMYGGLKVGLPRELALKASYQTVLGSAKLLAESSEHPSVLKEKVITPGGVTIEGIFELEDLRVRTAIMKAIEASTLKSKEISKEIEENLGKGKLA
jgi:pyrroline-5-carboxylate reductase